MLMEGLGFNPDDWVGSSFFPPLSLAFCVSYRCETFFPLVVWVWWLDELFEFLLLSSSSPLSSCSLLLCFFYRYTNNLFAHMFCVCLFSLYIYLNS